MYNNLTHEELSQLLPHGCFTQKGQTVLTEEQGGSKEHWTVWTTTPAIHAIAATEREARIAYLEKRDAYFAKPEGKKVEPKELRYK